MDEMMRLLIGYDGSAASQIVLEDLKKAGLPKRLEAIVITSADVLFPGYLEMATTDQSELVKEITASEKMARERAESDAKGAADRLKTMFPLWNVHSEAHSGSPAWALINKAEEWKANLIVVGAHGHSRLSRFMGSVSQLVLMNAPCSVRVARAPLDPKMNGELKIVVAVDGSPEAQLATKAVIKREWPASTQVRIFSSIHHHMALQMAHMVPPDIKVVHPVSGLEHKAVNDMVESIAGQFDKKIQAEGYVREGDPKHILVAEAETWKADCIFMGARGLSPLRRFLLGSVSLAVAVRAHCSVEVVRGEP